MNSSEPVVPVRLPDGRWLVPGNRWDLVPDEARRPDVTVSVIVPYYRERAQLDRVLEGLRLQDLPPDQLEVIVVDDGSPEPLSLDGDQGLAVKVLRQEDRGFRAAAARNLGAAAASGGVLCFLDQDTVPEPGYLRALTRLPSLAPDVLTVGRRRHAELAGWGPEEVRSWLDGTGSAPEELPAPEWLTDGYRSSRALLDADDESYRLVISAVMCCSAELFEAVGGFDETFDQYGGEDWDFAHRAWVAGAVLAHVEQAMAWHDGPDWAGRGDAASQEAEKARGASCTRPAHPRPRALG